MTSALAAVALLRIAVLAVTLRQVDLSAIAAAFHAPAVLVVPADLIFLALAGVLAVAHQAAVLAAQLPVGV